MRSISIILLVGVLGYTAGLHSQQIRSQVPIVKDCAQVSNTRSGIGHAYTGLVRNEDYDFTAHLEPGLTGWSGVAETAPFHGFVIFLDAKEQSCILFEVHLRVDEGDSQIRISKAKNLRLGKANAWQTTNVGIIKGKRISNISTSFSFKQANQIDDGEVLLVAPTSTVGKASQIYEAFLKSVTFGH